MTIFTHQQHMTDADLCNLYDRIMCEGLSSQVFYRGPVAKSQWINGVKESTWFVEIATNQGEVIGAVWLDGFRDRAAFIHLVSFRRKPVAIISIGKEVLRWLRANTGGAINTLLGYAPITNTQVRRYQKYLGFSELGEIPNAVVLPDGRTVNAFLSYYRLR